MAWEKRNGWRSNYARQAFSEACKFVRTSVLIGNLTINDFEEGEREAMGARTHEELAAQRLDRFRGLGFEHSYKFNEEWVRLYQQLQMDYEWRLLDRVQPPLSNDEHKMFRRPRR